MSFKQHHAVTDSITVVNSSGILLLLCQMISYFVTDSLAHAAACLAALSPILTRSIHNMPTRSASSRTYKKALCIPDGCCAAPAFGLSSSPATSTSAAASALPFSFPASNASTPASSSAFPLAVSTPLPSTSTAAGFSFGSAAATSAPLGFGASSAAASAASASSSLTLAAGSAASAGPASGTAYALFYAPECPISGCSV